MHMLLSILHSTMPHWSLMWFPPFRVWMDSDRWWRDWVQMARMRTMVLEWNTIYVLTSWHHVTISFSIALGAAAVVSCGGMWLGETGVPDSCRMLSCLGSGIYMINRWRNLVPRHPLTYFTTYLRASTDFIDFFSLCFVQEMKYGRATIS